MLGAGGGRGGGGCYFVGKSGMPVPLLTTATCFLRPLASKCSLGLETFNPRSLSVGILTSATGGHPLSMSQLRTDLRASPFGWSMMVPQKGVAKIATEPLTQHH